MPVANTTGGRLSQPASPTPGNGAVQVTITNDTGQPASDLYIAAPDEAAPTHLSGYHLQVTVTANPQHCGAAGVAPLASRMIVRVSWPSRCVAPGDVVSILFTVDHWVASAPGGLHASRSRASLDDRVASQSQPVWAWAAGRVALSSGVDVTPFQNGNSVSADGLQITLIRQDSILIIVRDGPACAGLPNVAETLIYGPATYMSASWADACVAPGDSVGLAIWPGHDSDRGAHVAWSRNGVLLPGAAAVVPEPAAPMARTGDMTLADSGVQMVDLADGAVLAAGRRCAPPAAPPGCQPPASTQLYDPTQGKWSQIDGPAGITELLPLADGRVLASTGFTGRGYIFDPQQRTWSLVSPDPGPGGEWLAHSDGSAVKPELEGTSGQPASIAMEVLDPGANGARLGSATAISGQAPAGPSVGLFPEAFALADGRVLVLGTSYSRGSALQELSTFVWDPRNDHWSAASPGPQVPHLERFVRLADGTVLASVGQPVGMLANGPLGDVSPSLRFDPAQNAWSQIAGAPTFPDGNMSVTPLDDGTVLVLGRVTADALQPSAFLYDPSSGSWMQPPAPRGVREVASAVKLADGRVLVIGPGFGVALASEVYDPATQSWGDRSSSTEPLDPRSAVLLPDGSVLLAGGSGDTYSTHAVLIRP